MVAGKADAIVMQRLRQILAAGPGSIEPSAKAGLMIVRSDRGAVAVAAGALREMARNGSLRRSGGRVELGKGDAPAVPMPGISGGMSSEFAATMIEEGGIAAQVTINLAESPLGQLYRRKSKDGRPFLAHCEFEAGERLRGDYTRGRIMPRLGVNWEAGLSGGRRGDGQGGADLTNAALAARQRVDRALKGVGPELGGLLVDICCFLKGLELVERERNWPVRSAKVMLKTALGVLARHYNPAATVPRQVLHWGSDDYRPSLT